MLCTLYCSLVVICVTKVYFMPSLCDGDFSCTAEPYPQHAVSDFSLAGTLILNFEKKRKIYYEKFNCMKIIALQSTNLFIPNLKNFEVLQSIFASQRVLHPQILSAYGSLSLARCTIRLSKKLHLQSSVASPSILWSAWRQLRTTIDNESLSLMVMGTLRTSQ